MGLGPETWPHQTLVDRTSLKLTFKKVQQCRGCCFSLLFSFNIVIGHGYWMRSKMRKVPSISWKAFCLIDQFVSLQIVTAQKINKQFEHNAI